MLRGSSASENAYKGILTGLPKPGGGEFRKFYSLPALNDPRIGALDIIVCLDYRNEMVFLNHVSVAIDAIRNGEWNICFTNPQVTLFTSTIVSQTDGVIFTFFVCHRRASLFYKDTLGICNSQLWQLSGDQGGCWENSWLAEYIAKASRGSI